MLLKKPELEAIHAGRVTHVFRRWRRPTVKTGGTLKTAVGVLAIDRVAAVARRDITQRDAAAAGHDSLPDLLEALDQREGVIYRIDIRYAGPDPRIRLREDDKPSDADFDRLRARLDRLDAASRTGPWTRTVLQAIRQHPHRRAAELAEETGFDKDRLKTNIRKLKNMGLTISHHPGYELSPRGQAVLRLLK